MQIRDVYPQPMPNFNVRLEYEYCDRLIGKRLGAETIKSIATSLEMKILKEDAEGVDLEVPAYRVDVQRPCDVVEDILRIYGYNNIEIPTMLKSSLTVKGEEDLEHKMENTVSEQLVGEGFNEILNNSLSRVAYYDEDKLNAYPWAKTVNVMNPLSADLGVMRQSILFGGLESIARNVNRKSQNLKFFELGNTYMFDAESRTEESPIKAYRQQYHLGMWVTGNRVQGSWIHADEESSVYELKAYLLNVLRRVGVTTGEVVEENGDNNIFSHSRSIKARGGKLIAEYGVLAAGVLKICGIGQPVFFADLNWTELMRLVHKHKIEYKEISKFPQVSRDLALLVDKGVEFAEIEKIAYQTEKKLLKNVELFDVYEGKNLPAGKKSYAVNFIIQDDNRTLNDKAIDAVMKKLIANLTNKLGAQLR